MARLGQISWVKHAFNTNALTIIKNALVFSKLYYCCNIWSNSSEHNLNRIQAVQNFAARIVSNTGKYFPFTVATSKESSSSTVMQKWLLNVWLGVHQTHYFLFVLYIRNEWSTYVCMYVANNQRHIKLKSFVGNISWRSDHVPKQNKSLKVTQENNWNIDFIIL